MLEQRAPCRTHTQIEGQVGRELGVSPGLRWRIARQWGWRCGFGEEPLQKVYPGGGGWLGSVWEREWKNVCRRELFLSNVVLRRQRTKHCRCLWLFCREREGERDRRRFSLGWYYISFSLSFVCQGQLKTRNSSEIWQSLRILEIRTCPSSAGVVGTSRCWSPHILKSLTGESLRNAPDRLIRMALVRAHEPKRKTKRKDTPKRMKMTEQKKTRKKEPEKAQSRRELTKTARTVSQLHCHQDMAGNPKGTRVRAKPMCHGSHQVMRLLPTVLHPLAMLIRILTCQATHHRMHQAIHLHEVQHQDLHPAIQATCPTQATTHPMMRGLHMLLPGLHMRQALHHPDRLQDMFRPTRHIILITCTFLHRHLLPVLNCHHKLHHKGLHHTDLRLQTLHLRGIHPRTIHWVLHRMVLHHMVLRHKVLRRVFHRPPTKLFLWRTILDTFPRHLLRLQRRRHFSPSSHV